MTTLRKTLYLLPCLLIAASTLLSCIEEYEADISADDTDLLVVEGTICSGELNKFYLTRTQPLNSAQPVQAVRGARVSVRGSDGSEYQAQDTGDCYSCQIGSLKSDVEYYLHIESDGEVYESDPQKPLPTERIASITGMQNTPESNIDVLITPAPPIDPEEEKYYSWSYDETWEVHSDYSTFIFFDINKMEKVDTTCLFPERGWKDALGQTILVGTGSNYEGQHIRMFKLYDIGRGDERIFYKYSGLVRQRAITKAEYEYELARRQAGYEMGGLFTPLPSALPTNIQCLTSHKSVIGFVGCSMNTSRYRFFLRPSNYSVFRPYRGDGLLRLEKCSLEDCVRMVKHGLFLVEWDDNRMMGGPLNTAWAYQYQLDVTMRGAYIKEPDYWSLEENISY